MRARDIRLVTACFALALAATACGGAESSSAPGGSSETAVGAPTSESEAPAADATTEATETPEATDTTETTETTATTETGETTATGEPVSLAFAHIVAEAHPFHACGIAPMAENLAAGESGLTMDVFPAAQLGSNQENIENIVGDNLAMSIVGLGELSRFHEPMSVLDANYAFDDFDHLLAVARGEIGEELFTGLSEAAPIRVLDVWFGGLRQATTNTPVRTPEDLNGVKMRAIETPIGLANVESLGAEPTPVAFPELYLGLSQGVVDGQENPISIIDSAKLYEVQDYVNLTNHAVFAGAVVIGETVWQSMSPDQQEALEAEVLAGGDRDRQCVDEGLDEILQRWRDEDLIEIVEDVDVEAFREKAAAELPPQFEDVWGDLYQRIRDAA